MVYGVKRIWEIPREMKSEIWRKLVENTDATTSLYAIT